MNKQTAFLTAGVAAAALALGGTTIALASTTGARPEDHSSATASPTPTGTPTVSPTFTSTPTSTPTTSPTVAPTVSPTSIPTSTPAATSTPTISASAKLQLAEAAALKAVGGGTVVFVEASGSSNHAYEVRIKLADGSISEVKLAADFTVLRIEKNVGATDDHGHDATDDHGTDDHGTDDPATHDVNDDHGGDRSGTDDDSGSGKGGSDDGSGHDSGHDSGDDHGDDHGGHGHGSDD